MSFKLNFGYLGANSPIMNFFNMLFFGQNKRGMKVFSSIEGNTWRGFSPSAESIGEFFGFIIIFYLLYLIEKYSSFKITDLFFLLPIFYGLYRANNFAVVVYAGYLLSNEPGTYKKDAFFQNM